MELIQFWLPVLAMVGGILHQLEDLCQLQLMLGQGTVVLRPQSAGRIALTNLGQADFSLAQAGEVRSVKE